MDSTHEFVEKVHEKQVKDLRNKQHQGKGSESSKLPGKQHSTNK